MRMPRAARPLSVTVLAYLYIFVGTVGFAYHVTELHSARVWQTAVILLVRLLAIVIGTFMLRGARWARPAAITWMAYHVAVGALHSWADALLHLVLLCVFAVVLLRPAVAAYFHHGRP